MAVFPGINTYAAKVCAGQPDRDVIYGRTVEDNLLGEIGDLLGQAYAADPKHAPGIVAAAEERARTLDFRAATAKAALADARRDLSPPSRPVASTPKQGKPHA